MTGLELTQSRHRPGGGHVGVEVFRLLLGPCFADPDLLVFKLLEENQALEADRLSIDRLCAQSGKLFALKHVLMHRSLANSDTALLSKEVLQVAHLV